MSEQFTVVTRAMSRSSKVVVHSYGPYSTRAKAVSVAKKAKREFYADPLVGGATLAVHVTKVIDIDAMNADAETGEYI